MQLKIGADPELFVMTPDGVISGHDFPCGTKDKPRKTKHGWVQIDGCALEVNVPPATSKRQFIRNVKNVLNDLQKIVENHDEDAVLVAEPYVLFGQEYLSSLPESVRRLGCNADFNAYTYSVNPVPDVHAPIRTGAGHVHLGWGKFQEDMTHFQTCASLVRELDYYLGLPSLHWDTDPHRRELYGQAGAFRPKKYGVEYRVLSNVWVDDPELSGRVFSLAKKCFINWNKGMRIADEYKDFALRCINDNITEWPIKAPKLAEFLEV